ncbi:MAG: SAM-dependent methyltransferase [Rhodospirillaceae bacterium]|nr:SAM-dependent methyltransferase [Rhodospirillaceae bacterium]|tara:strand:- start:658 stop:1317 length:660 start_codon:yes stop_codon:yes gene_type:complete
MKNLDFLKDYHKNTKRDYYKERKQGLEKVNFAIKAKQFGRLYWDGDRDYGYGGYTYDGRWKKLAKRLIKYYKLNNNSKILDIGCGKGFLIYEIWKILNNKVYGLEISKYAIANSKKEIRNRIKYGNAKSLPYKNKSFDLAISINTLHNLEIEDLFNAISQINRVAKKKYIVVDSFRNEKERINLMSWQLTCNALFSVKEWEWILKTNKYNGDYSFIFYE